MSHSQPFQIHSFQIESTAGTTLHGILQTPDAPGPRPTVVICHGFKGFMEWGFFPALADLLVDRGLTTLRFNYSGSGQLPGEDRVSDLDAFRRNTLSQELAETLSVLDAAGRTVGEGRVDRDRLALVGHSRGGGSAILASAQPEWQDRLRALVTWNAVATFRRFGDDAMNLWRQNGVLPIQNGRTGQTLELGPDLLAELESGSEAIEPLVAARKRHAPWLIVHGEADETVALDDARRLFDHAAGTKELRIVADGSHTFGAKHPFAGPTPQLIEALNATQTWLKRHLD